MGLEEILSFSKLIITIKDPGKKSADTHEVDLRIPERISREYVYQPLNLKNPDSAV